MDNLADDKQDRIRNNIQRDLRHMTSKPKHEHQYTIPVEWIYEASLLHKDSPRKIYGESSDGHFTRKRVSKLRCLCGSEIDR